MRTRAEKRGGEGTNRARTINEQAFDTPEYREGLQHLARSGDLPELAMMMDEAVERLPKKLRVVALLRMEGLGKMEIASKLRLSTRSIERRLEQIEDIWKKAIAD